MMMEVPRHADPGMPSLFMPAKHLWRRSIVPMPVADCYYEEGEDPLKWLPGVMDEVEAQYHAIIEGSDCRPWLRLRWFAVHEFRRHDWSRSPSKLHPKLQAAYIAKRIFEGRMRFEGLSLSHEELWAQPDGTINPNDHHLRAAYLRDVTRPIRELVNKTMNWNFIKAHDSISAIATWGEYPPGSIDTTSCPETYLGWYQPGKPVPADKERFHTPAAIHKAFVNCLNTIRSCEKTGMCVPWLPVAIPDQEIALKLTREMIIHSILTGVTRFGWSPYMTDEVYQMAMADKIQQAVDDGEHMLEPLSALSTNPGPVTTHGYRTPKFD